MWFAGIPLAKEATFKNAFLKFCVMKWGIYIKLCCTQKNICVSIKHLRFSNYRALWVYGLSILHVFRNAPACRSPRSHPHQLPSLFLNWSFSTSSNTIMPCKVPNSVPLFLLKNFIYIYPSNTIQDFSQVFYRFIFFLISGITTYLLHWLP